MAWDRQLLQIGDHVRITTSRSIRDNTLRCTSGYIVYIDDKIIELDNGEWAWSLLAKKLEKQGVDYDG